VVFAVWLKIILEPFLRQVDLTTKSSSEKKSLSPYHPNNDGNTFTRKINKKFEK
jgi:hypothetical protein